MASGLELKLRNKLMGKITCPECSNREFPATVTETQGGKCNKCGIIFSGKTLAIRSIRVLIYAAIVLVLGYIIGPLTNPDGKSPFALFAFLLLLHGAFWAIKGTYQLIRTLSSGKFY
jgi:hypothetical protein